MTLLDVDVDVSTMERYASLSQDERYRYTLTRVWNHDLSVVAWIMINPSTADALVDDPTITRCIGFAKAWGYGGILVVNLFALRATDPTALSNFAPNDPSAPSTTTTSSPQSTTARSSAHGARASLTTGATAPPASSSSSVSVAHAFTTLASPRTDTRATRSTSAGT